MILSVQNDLTLHPTRWNEIVHPVQTAQEGALPATRRPNQGGHLILIEIKGYVLQCVKITVIKVEMLCRHLYERIHFPILWL